MEEGEKERKCTQNTRVYICTTCVCTYVRTYTVIANQVWQSELYELSRQVVLFFPSMGSCQQSRHEDRVCAYVYRTRAV